MANSTNAPGGKNRLPPGQTLVTNFPVLSYGPTPRFNPAKWDFRVMGLVERPLRFTWEEFRAIPGSREVADFHCVTTWSRYDNQWDGLSSSDLLAACRPREEARFVVLYSNDGYTTNLAIEDFAAEDALLAHSWSGAPLDAEHGGPVRLVVPHLYFWKSAKWLKAIEFLADDAPGYWEVRGYHNRGDPWTEQRYSEA
jgi:DMSO/TMAO reductase YedYZ molybdopterin-dependent catalytic subunit